MGFFFAFVAKNSIVFLEEEGAGGSTYSNLHISGGGRRGLDRGWPVKKKKNQPAPKNGNNF